MVTEPKSMDELVYHTIRTKGEGKIHAWVYRTDCPECGKGKMGKPHDKKTGKVKVRATEYVCPECAHTIEKVAYEETLEMEAKYTCPNCKKEGSAAVPFKRKKVSIFDKEKDKKVSVDAVRFQCEHCNENIDVVKKMKL